VSMGTSTLSCCHQPRKKKGVKEKGIRNRYYTNSQEAVFWFMTPFLPDTFSSPQQQQSGTREKTRASAKGASVDGFYVRFRSTKPLTSRWDWNRRQWLSRPESQFGMRPQGRWQPCAGRQRQHSDFTGGEVCTCVAWFEEPRRGRGQWSRDGTQPRTGDARQVAALVAKRTTMFPDRWTRGGARRPL